MNALALPTPQRREPPAARQACPGATPQPLQLTLQVHLSVHLTVHLTPPATAAAGTDATPAPCPAWPALRVPQPSALPRPSPARPHCHS